MIFYQDFEWWWSRLNPGVPTRKLVWGPGRRTLIVVHMWLAA